LLSLLALVRLAVESSPADTVDPRGPKEE
jgi:hypothetical protein